MSKVVATICTCGRPTRNPVKGRCERCAAPHERERSAERRTHTEPWARLYGLRAWRRCRAFALARDGHRCRLRLPGCIGTERLRGHHKRRTVAQLWAIAAGDWDLFVELACDPTGVVTACEPCHVRDHASSRGGASHAPAGRPQSAPGSKNSCTGSQTFFPAAA